MPEGTPIFDSSKSISISWNMYWKAIGDTALNATIVRSTNANKNLKYVLNGNLCICNYYTTSPSPTPLSLQLPFISALPFEVNGTIYIAGTSTIEVPSNLEFVQFMYVIAFDKIG